MSYQERFIALAHMAAIYAYCVEISEMNSFFLWCGKEYRYDWDGHSLVRALYLTGLIDTALWHEWNDTAYSLYKNPGVPDPGHYDLADVAARVFKPFECAAPFVSNYSKRILGAPAPLSTL